MLPTAIYLNNDDWNYHNECSNGKYPESSLYLILQFWMNSNFFVLGLEEK